MANKRIDEKEEFIKKHPNVQGRVIPHRAEAEGSLLGSVMIDGQIAAKYLPMLDDEDFFVPGHKNIFAAMRKIFASSRTIDLVTLIQQMEADGTLEISGGTDYVSSLVVELPSSSNAEDYFKIVKKMSQLRAIIEVSKKMADEAFALDPDDSALEHAESALYALTETGRRGKLELANGAIKAAMDELRHRQENRDAYRGVPSGFPVLDSKLGGGFQKGDLIILAARPGQGKTSFAMNCAVNAALAKRPDTKKPYTVAVFSLEMTAVQLARRMLCSVGNFDMSKANRADINEMGWAKLFGAQARFEGTRLYIDESGAVTPAEILSKCRQLKHADGLDFVMIDYLQLMKSGMRTDNIVREIAEITRAIKLAAKDLDVPILLLSQMSRAIEKRTSDPTPQLSDLRDSGAIEQDADIVFFLDRTTKKQDVEDPAEDAAAIADGNVVYLNIAKHRNGETGSVKLVWTPSTVTFKCLQSVGAEPGKHSGRRGYSDGNDPVAPPATEKNQYNIEDIDDIDY